MTTVLIADDEALVRGGIRMILDSQPDLEVVGEAPDGDYAVRLAAELQPDVVLMDVRMPRMSGIEAARRILLNSGSVRVMMLTTFDDDEYLYEALKAGASGFLLKSVPPEHLADSVRALARGDALLAPSITRRLIEQYTKQPRPGSADHESLRELTEREKDVLILMARGLSNAELAERLFLSEGTVKTHITHVFRKLSLRDRAQAVILAYESGLVQPGEGP